MTEHFYGPVGIAISCKKMIKKFIIIRKTSLHLKILSPMHLKRRFSETVHETSPTIEICF